jgi:hypothetical protein
MEGILAVLTAVPTVMAFLVFMSLMAFTAFIMALIAYIELRSFNKSTHQIQYMPIDEQVDKENQEYLKKLGSDPFSDESWATSDASIEKQNKLYKEDLEEALPEFSEGKPEKYSF